MNKFSVVCALAILPAFAQTNTVVGAGYSALVPLTVAPGQLVTLFVEGIGASLTQPVRAPSVPLPTVLAGISVTLKQFSSETPVPSRDREGAVAALASNRAHTETTALIATAA